MKALVVGATGRTGQEIVTELLSRGIPVRAMVRDIEAARQSISADVELVSGDLTQPETLAAALVSCTVVFNAAGVRPSWDPLEPFRVDYEGTKALVDAAKQQGIQHFILVSSLCVSQFFHPLNLFWLILVWKKQAEEYITQSGIPYTIVRPGGLKSEDNDDILVMTSADTLFEGSIPRRKVAQVCVETLFQPTARNRIIEIVAKPEIPALSMEQLFTSVSIG
ncbi:MAG: SDR family oxidoreductase [Cyanophyceae cyanobacterium]